MVVRNFFMSLLLWLRLKIFGVREAIQRQLAAAHGAATSGYTQEETAKRLRNSPWLMAAASFQITFL
jgi:hypothetical protein